MALELVCLGVGKGASCIMRGIPSTAFALIENGDVRLLVDCGAGIALTCQQRFGYIPERIFITHNHTDHTGDLPSAIKFTRTPPHLYGSGDVLDLVRAHRLHDAPDTQRELIDRVTWHAAENDELHLDARDTLRLFRSQHAYVCYGFVLYRDERPILGYSADSGYNDAIYDRISAAPVAIVDARDEASEDHASFAQVEAYAAAHAATRFYIVHYESTDYAPAQRNVALLRPGDSLTLLE